MIDTLFLANLLQGQLNTNELGLNFLVFSDEGDLRKTIKKGNNEKTYVNGLLEITSSTIVPIKNISFQTINTQFMILVDLVNSGFVYETDEQRKQSRNMINIKSVINRLIDTLNGTPFTISEGGKTYNVTAGISKPTVGQKMSIGEIFECVPLYVNISFAFFENGVNTNDCKVIINGEDIYFTRMVISKVKTADQSEFAITNGGRTGILLGGKSLDLVMPVVNSPVNELIMKDILDDDILNKAIAVRVETPLYSKNFIGVLGDCSVSGDVNANLGYNVSIVQGIEHVLNYDENWITKTIGGETGNLTVKVKLKDDGIVYWGDGTSEYVEAETTITRVFYGTTPSPIPMTTIRAYNCNAIETSMVPSGGDITLE